MKSDIENVSELLVACLDLGLEATLVQTKEIPGQEALCDADECFSVAIGRGDQLALAMGCENGGFVGDFCASEQLDADHISFNAALALIRSILRV